MRSIDLKRSVFAVLFVAFSGCGPSSTNASGPNEMGSLNDLSGLSDLSDSCASGCPENYWNIDGNLLTGTCGCEYYCVRTQVGNDPIDGNYIDDNCDGSDGVVGECEYVSISQGSDTTGDGTQKNPFQSIDAAIKRAQANAVPAVCLSGEVYSSAVTLASGINVYGGFDKDDPDVKWKRSPKVTTTVTATGLVFDAPQIDTETHLEGLTVAANAAVLSGANTYGIRLGGGTGQFFIRFNTITVGSGANGSRGVDAQPQTNPTAPSGIAGQAGTASGSAGGSGASAPSCVNVGGKGGDGGYDNSSGLPAARALAVPWAAPGPPRTPARPPAPHRARPAEPAKMEPMRPRAFRAGAATASGLSSPRAIPRPLAQTARAAQTAVGAAVAVAAVAAAAPGPALVPPTEEEGAAAAVAAATAATLEPAAVGAAAASACS